MDYSKLKPPTSKDKKPIVLFYNGTFAPIHDGHLAAIDSAFEALDKAGYEVLGAYLSPAHGCYSEAKLKENYIPSHHRMEMCFLACEQRPRLNVDTWEMMQDSFNSFVHAMPEFYNRLKQFVPFLKDLDFTVGWIVGVDSYHPVMFKGIPKYLDICIKNRSGFDEKIQSLIKEQAVAEAIENSLFVDAEILDISSTAIRKAVQTGESLEKFYKNLPQVAEYIVKHGLWKAPKPLEFLRIEPANVGIGIIDLSAQLTPENLTIALSTSGWLNKDEKIVKFQKKLLGEQFGCSGSLYLLEEIEYEPPNAEKLKKFVFKFGGKAAGFGQFELEEKFFTKLSVDDPLFPKCLAAFKSKTNKAFTMEFLEKYKCFDMCDGIETPLLFAAIRELARMHAMYAGQKLEEVHTLGSAALRDWMISRLTGYGMKFTKDAVEHAYGPECFDEMNHTKLDQDVNAYIDRLEASKFQSILHLDSWIHNWMFHEDIIEDYKKQSDMSTEEISMQIGHPRHMTRGKVALIDWEYTSKGNGLVDFGFFFWTSAINPKEIEVAAALFYYTQLCHFGITNYTYNSFLKDYRDAKIYTYHRLISTFGHCMGPAYNSAEQWGNIRLNMLQLMADHVPDKFKKQNNNDAYSHHYKTNKSKRDCNMM